MMHITANLAKKINFWLRLPCWKSYRIWCSRIWYLHFKRTQQ